MPPPPPPPPPQRKSRKPWSEDVPASHALLIILGFLVVGWSYVRCQAGSVHSCESDETQTCSCPDGPDGIQECSGDDFGPCACGWAVVAETDDIAKFADLDNLQQRAWVDSAAAGTLVGYDSRSIATCIDTVSRKVRTGDVPELDRTSVGQAFDHCGIVEAEASSASIILTSSTRLAFFAPADADERFSFVRRTARTKDKIDESNSDVLKVISRCTSHFSQAVRQTGVMEKYPTATAMVVECGKLQAGDHLDDDGVPAALKQFAE